MVQKYISKPGGWFYVLYIEFKKAFDGLKHLNLFNTINRRGVRGEFVYQCTQNCVDVYKSELPKLHNTSNVT
jgi:hypothetical protein